jgi:hypothetical protein
MILIVNNHPQKLEGIFAMVNRLKHIPGALKARNNQNQSALLLACLFLPNMPFVARFIAEAMGEKDIPVNEVCICGKSVDLYTCRNSVCSCTVHLSSDIPIIHALLRQKSRTLLLLCLPCREVQVSS